MFVFLPQHEMNDRHSPSGKGLFFNYKNLQARHLLVEEVGVVLYVVGEEVGGGAHGEHVGGGARLEAPRLQRRDGLVDKNILNDDFQLCVCHKTISVAVEGYSGRLTATTGPLPSGSYLTHKIYCGRLYRL